jgi:transposase-like protein
VPAERMLKVDNVTFWRWGTLYPPGLLERFNRRKLPINGRLHIDGTYNKDARDLLSREEQPEILAA